MFFFTMKQQSFENLAHLIYKLVTPSPYNRSFNGRLYCCSCRRNLTFCNICNTSIDDVYGVNNPASLHIVYHINNGEHESNIFWITASFAQTLLQNCKSICPEHHTSRVSQGQIREQKLPISLCHNI